MRLCISKFVLIFYFTPSFLTFGTELRSVEEVIRGIDELLGEYDQDFELDNSTDAVIPENTDDQFDPVSKSQKQDALDIESENRPYTEGSPPVSLEGSFRLEDELIPKILRKPSSPSNYDIFPNDKPSDFSSSDISNYTAGGIIPEENDTAPEQLNSQIKLLPRIDYQNAGLEDLLKEVDVLELPQFEAPLILPPESTIDAKKVLPLSSASTREEITYDPSLQTNSKQDDYTNQSSEDYIVLGERIDKELREKIREAIISTRTASGGAENPFVTRSVYRAESNCNKVLGRLNAPFHKRYRRDIILSLIRMHERNKQWVNAAKTYERYLDEFAADDAYPFEEHEDAPGIPDLQAGLNSPTKLIEGKSRGAPTIPETHVRLGKIYRHLGAHRMALNKFYDAIRGTLTSSTKEAFVLADRRSGRTLISRSDAESNQAMFEIAETFMDSEDYDQAVKFYDRLWRLDQLRDFDRAIVRFKQGVAHYRRALDNLRRIERNNKLSPEMRDNIELPFDKKPRADFAKVKEILRGYGTIYPQSPYVPESHYILALTFEQLNQDEESISELLVLLKEADFHPDKIAAIQLNRTTRDQDLVNLNKMRRIWNFWKKKTGNYLANQFFENAEYFNAYRIYSALRKIDLSPTWQVPLLYQIALCEEKLGNYVQATETYISIEEFVSTVKEAREDLANSEYLNFVFGMAKWRREQLEETRAIRQAVNRYGIFSTSAQANSSTDAIQN